MERWLPYLKTLFGVWTDDPKLTLSGQENTENQMVLSSGTNVWTEKQPEISLANRTNQPKQPIEHFFTPMEVVIECLEKIESIKKFDKIKFQWRGKFYDAIVSFVESQESFEHLEIRALLTNKIT
jgi:hypothetical protein